MLSSCEKLLIEKSPADNPENNFNILWEQVDEKYSFFDFKHINWDSVYNVYHPKISDGMSEEAQFDVMANMLFELKDGHVNLKSYFDRSRNWKWYLDYPQNFDYSIIERNYLKDDYLITGPFRNQIIDSIGYIYYGSFSNSFTEKQLDFIMNRFKNLKGIIIDVRDNGGGSESNAYQLAGRFADRKRHAFDEFYKNGPGHSDFTEGFPRYVEPKGGQSYFNRPVVVLTNRLCFSATNSFITLMRVLPNVILIGDSTGGGGGTPIDYDLPNGWTFRFSASKSITVDGINNEGGLPPDIKVDLKDEDKIKGKDTILETAIDFINP